MNKRRSNAGAQLFLQRLRSDSFYGGGGGGGGGGGESGGLGGLSCGN